MPQPVAYPYQRPIRPARRAYFAPLRRIAVLTAFTALFVVTHQPFFAAPSLDAAYGGTRSPGDGRAVLYLGKDLRYRVHIEEQAGTPRTCTMVTTTGEVVPLDLDRSRTGDDRAVIQDGGRRYRWFGSFRAPVDAAAAVDCDDAHAPLRVQVAVSGAGMFVGLLGAWLGVLIWGAVRIVRTFRRRRESMQQAGVRPPARNAATPADEALHAMHDTDRTVVLFWNGTLVAAGHRPPEDAASRATERLTSQHRDDRSTFKVAPAGDAGWLVSFPALDLAVYVSATEAKDTSTQGIGRCARAKLNMDRRDPVVLTVREPHPPLNPTPA